MTKNTNRTTADNNPYSSKPETELHKPSERLLDIAEHLIREQEKQEGK